MFSGYTADQMDVLSAGIAVVLSAAKRCILVDGGAPLVVVGNMRPR
jgi:hypothetical protein